MTATIGAKCKRPLTQRKSSFIKLSYGSRALEWLNIKQFLLNLLVFFDFSHLCPSVQDIVFAWSYLGNLSMTLYRPSSVFKNFSFFHLLDDQIQCACSTATRLRLFCDSLTINEYSIFVNLVFMSEPRIWMLYNTQDCVKPLNNISTYKVLRKQSFSICFPLVSCFMQISFYLFCKVGTTNINIFFA
jgi:hypothetical protein